MTQPNPLFQSSPKQITHLDFLLNLPNEEYRFKKLLNRKQPKRSERSFQKGPDIVWDSKLLNDLILTCEN